MWLWAGLKSGSHCHPSAFIFHQGLLPSSQSQPGWLGCNGTAASWIKVTLLSKGEGLGQQRREREVDKKHTCLLHLLSTVLLISVALTFHWPHIGESEPKSFPLWWAEQIPFCHLIHVCVGLGQLSNVPFMVLT